MRLRFILASEGLLPPGLQVKTLSLGTTLYHGTTAKVEFQMPQKGSWFAFTQKASLEWADWGHDEGRRRVLEFRVARPIEFIDTTKYEDWLSLAKFLRSDESAYAMRKGILRKHLSGWYGPTEVLLADPARHLQFIGEV